MDARLAGNLGRHRAGLQRRRDQPLLLGSQPTPAPLHRFDDLNAVFVM
jgi:hypothetical protein